MLDTDHLVDTLSTGSDPTFEFSSDPTQEEIREVVRELKQQGLCGRRIGEHQLGPYFIASPDHGQREIDILEEILAEEYNGSDLCLQTRQSECSRLRGGCKGNQ